MTPVFDETCHYSDIVTLVDKPKSNQILKLFT